MELKLTKNNVIIIIIFLIVLFSGLILYNYRQPKPMVEEKTKISLVTDYGRFFSISNAANKYISYLNNQDINNLILLLNSKYKEKNNINSDNILHNLTLLDTEKEYIFEARKMYNEKINKNIIRYYIYGYLSENVMDEYFRPEDYYLIIDLDINNLIFDVTPYNGKIFKEDINE
ncbi:MAG: hypothetical protein PHH51_03250 [Bacilli bacterium]|nr:hypothetical protein [Bacilli bacterium]MDD3896019.1 hypothetical protein [Bacilli bacterium]MDD4407679.1 hypothetical protein [Bacilli bacterium]